MRQFVFCGILLATAATFSACNNSKKAEEKEIVSEKLSNEGALEAEIKAIDEIAEKSGQIASSLKYTKENGASIVVHATLSATNEILKVEEEYAEANGGNYGTNSFYLKNKIPFAVREYFEDRQDAANPKFVERMSYYDDKGKVIKTIEKRVNFEEELEAASFVPVALHSVSIDRAMTVLDQKGEFETTFQGFVAVQALNYLVVGKPGKDSYSSAMRVDFGDEFINTALANQRAYMNKKCRVSFETIQDASGFEYQMYTGGEWAE